MYWLDARLILMKLIKYLVNTILMSPEVVTVKKRQSEDNNQKYQSCNLNGTTCKCLVTEIFTCSYTSEAGHAVAQLVEARRYKSRRSRVRFPTVSLEFFIDIILPGRTMALGLTQPLTEMSTRNISWG